MLVGHPGSDEQGTMEVHGQVRVTDKGLNEIIQNRRKRQ